MWVSMRASTSTAEVSQLTSPGSEPSLEHHQRPLEPLSGKGVQCRVGDVRSLGTRRLAGCRREGDRERQRVRDDEQLRLGTRQHGAEAAHVAADDLVTRLAAAGRDLLRGGGVGPGAVLLQRCALEGPVAWIVELGLDQAVEPSSGERLAAVIWVRSNAVVMQRSRR